MSICAHHCYLSFSITIFSAMHFSCFDNYFVSILNRSESQMHMMLDTDRGQFDCPLCKRLSNLLVPAVNRAITPIRENNDRDGDGDGEDNEYHKREVEVGLEVGRHKNKKGHVRAPKEERSPGFGKTEIALSPAVLPVAVIGVLVQNVGDMRKRKTESISYDSDSTGYDVKSSGKSNSTNKSHRPALCFEGACSTVSATVKNESTEGSLSSDPPSPLCPVSDSEEIREDLPFCSSPPSSSSHSFSTSMGMAVDQRTHTGKSKVREDRDRGNASPSPSLPYWLRWIRQPKLVNKVTETPLTRGKCECKCHVTALCLCWCWYWLLSLSFCVVDIYSIAIVLISLLC